jgi:hypothetical protein
MDNCLSLCSTRAASILPSRPHITVAVAHSDGHGRLFFSVAEGLSLTNASTRQAARDRVIYHAMIRGADILPRVANQAIAPTCALIAAQSIVS